jgi:RNA polymerase sigma-70 factor (ECF subfamily)
MGKKEASSRQSVVKLSYNRQTQLQILSAEELALRSQQGCQECFEELVERYNVRLYQFLRSRTAGVQDAEDLVQDTFVKAYRNIHRYRTSWRFSTWLFTIGSRLATSHHRSLLRRQAVAKIEAKNINPADTTVQQETFDGLWAIARDLSKDQYQALWLKYAEDMSIKEIAKVLKKTQVGVKVLLYRARTNLARRLRNIAAEPVRHSCGGNETAAQPLPKEQIPVMKVEGA